MYVILKKIGIKAEHYCPKNFEGNSGAMEPQGAFDMFKYIRNSFEGRVYFQEFLSDDDATTRATLSHQSQTKMDAYQMIVHL